MVASGGVQTPACRWLRVRGVSTGRPTEVNPSGDGVISSVLFIVGLVMVSTILQLATGTVWC